MLTITNKLHFWQANKLQLDEPNQHVTCIRMYMLQEGYNESRIRPPGPRGRGPARRRGYRLQAWPGCASAGPSRSARRGCTPPRCRPRPPSPAAGTSGRSSSRRRRRRRPAQCGWRGTWRPPPPPWSPPCARLTTHRASTPQTSCYSVNRRRRPCSAQLSWLHRLMAANAKRSSTRESGIGWGGNWYYPGGLQKRGARRRSPPSWHGWPAAAAAAAGAALAGTKGGRRGAAATATAGILDAGAPAPPLGNNNPWRVQLVLWLIIGRQVAALPAFK